MRQFAIPKAIKFLGIQLTKPGKYICLKLKLNSLAKLHYSARADKKSISRVAIDSDYVTIVNSWAILSHNHDCKLNKLDGKLKGQVKGRS